MGRMRSVRKNVELDGVRVLAGIAKFAPEGMDERVDSLWPMIEGGFLNAGSVGFHVRAAHWPTEEEAEEMGLDLEGEHRMTEIVDKAELVEYSIVPVGADHKAMVLRDVNDEGLELRAFMDQLLDSGTWTRDDALWVREVFRSEIPEEDEDDGGDEPQETIEVSGTDAENDDAEEAEEADTEADGAAADGEVDDDPSAPGEGEEAGEGEASDDESGESDDEERVLDLLSVEEMEAIVRDAIAASEAPPAEENDADSSDSSRDEILVRTVATIFANEIRELRSEIDTIRKEVREQRNRQSALDAALGLLPAVAAS